MRQKGNIVLIVLISIVALAIIGYLIYQNMQLRKQSPSPTPATTAEVQSPSPIATITPTPTATTLKPGWKLYQNEKYGFELSYPASYKVLTSSEDLYGWPKAILLLYDGGQSYDLAIEIWNSEAEYRANYIDTSTLTVLTVYKTKDGKFLTLLNQNDDPEVAEIISTFKFTE